MGKKGLLCLILSLGIFPTILLGQIPNGYYDRATGLTGNELKVALHTIILGHTKYPYTATGTDVWDILQAADEDPNNSSNVILIYTGRSQSKTDNSSTGTYTGNRWNREHLWAKSHGFPNESDTAYTDCFHLRPADESVNTLRSNRDFDNGGLSVTEAPGCYYNNDNWSWEVRDAVKGDVARAIFYMATRYSPGYHSDMTTYDLTIVDSTNTDPDNLNNPLFGKLSILLAWNAQDPVDDAERARNEVIYSYQHNRNPYIDHPEYVELIWGNTTPKAEPSNNATDFSPHNIVLQWEDATGPVLPTGYLVRMSSVSFDAIATPVDGTPVSDNSNDINVAYGAQTCTFKGLTPGTVYYFKIFSYTGSGATIDYKTDAAPEVSKVAN